jgi:hypothetical protein
LEEAAALANFYLNLYLSLAILRFLEELRVKYTGVLEHDKK